MVHCNWRSVLSLNFKLIYYLNYVYVRLALYKQRLHCHYTYINLWLMQMLLSLKKHQERTTSHVAGGKLLRALNHKYLRFQKNSLRPSL